MVEKTDKYVVERDGELFTVKKEDIRNIAPDDLLVVNRDGVDYSITGAVFIEEGGGGTIDDADDLDPEENSSATPGYTGGTGTLADPFILTSENCYLAGNTVSNQIITLFGMEPGTAVTIVDTDVATNGVKFQQPTLTANKAGYVNFQMQYQDVPSTDGGGSASAILNIGDIYWSWDVTISNQGIERLLINEVLGQDGSYHVPIYGPDFTSALLPASEVISEQLTGLTPDQTLEKLPTTTVTGVGTGLTLNVITDDAGDCKYILIEDGGTDYAFEDQVTVDLESIGGNAATPLTVFTAPVSSPSITFKITPFTSLQGGDFLKQQWYIGTDPTFRDIDQFDVYDVTENTTNPTITTTLDTGTVYYAKARYQSQMQIYSGWSDVIKGGTISAFKNFSYTISNLNLEMDVGRFQSFISPEINIEKTPGTYFTHITQTTGLCAAWPNQPQGNGNGRRCDGGYGNSTNAQAIYIQVRNTLQLKVTSVDDFGAVLSIEQTNFPIGLSDYFQNKAVDTTTNGSGTGYKPVINRVNGITTWISTNSMGSDYAPGDIITFVSPLGNGTNGSGPDCSEINDGFTDLNVSHNTSTLDSEHDVLIHGLASSSGKGSNGSCDVSGGGGASTAQRWHGSREGDSGGGAGNQDGTTPGPGPTAAATESNSLYIERGGNSQGPGDTGECCYGKGGAGGAGWGGGKSGANGRGEANRRTGGSGGSVGFSKINPLYIPDFQSCGSQASFSNTGTYLYIGGAEVTVGTDYYYRLY